MIDKEEINFLQKVKEEVDNLIDKLCNKYSYDRAYFRFKLTCSLFDSGFRKTDEIELFNDDKSQYCEFCGKETYFYYKDKDMYLCVECYSKLNKEDGK